LIRNVLQDIERNTYNVSVGKPEEDRQLERPRLTLEDNIRTDLKEMGWEGVEWMLLA
jgi:hypothetical protein